MPPWSGLHSPRPAVMVPAKMRLLLITWLAVGMAPGLGEIAETAVHLTISRHLAHSEADHGDLGDQGSEHGCGTTQHHCDCCASQVVAAVAPTVVLRLTSRCGDQPASTGIPASLHEPTPPYRPPILA